MPPLFSPVRILSLYYFNVFLLFLLFPFVLKRFFIRYPQGRRCSLLPHTLTFLRLFFPKFTFLLQLVCQVWAPHKQLWNTDVKVYLIFFSYLSLNTLLHNSWNSIWLFNCHEVHSLCLWRTLCLNSQILTFKTTTFYTVVHHKVVPLSYKIFFMYYTVFWFLQL